MTQAQKKILNQFSPELRNHIVEFCKAVSAIECDVFVLLARKAACFISILEDSGLLTLNGMVVSERILDYNSDWIKDKDVVIIDDTIISGTSIHRITEQLQALGVRKIRVQVFCINNYWFVENLLSVGTTSHSFLQLPYLSMEHTASLKFCRDIVKVLSIYPRPYSTDFPIYESIRLTEYHFHQIQELLHWHVVDTTSQLQLRHGVRCFSVNPDHALQTAFDNYLGISLQPYSYMKIRVYSQRFDIDGKRSFFLCRVLPLVIFNPVSDIFLEDFVNAICRSETTDFRLVQAQLTSGKAMLRFVQFYIAHRFFLFCLDKLEAFLNERFKYNFNRRELELIFPPKLVEILRTFRFEAPLSLSKEDLAGAFLEAHSLAKPTHHPYNPFKITYKLQENFLKFYYDKELVARRIVRKLRTDAFHDELYTKIMNRLNEGYTFGDLRSMLDGLVLPQDQNVFLSNFLDNSIDSGIIVPVTLEEDGFVSRGYRHGEEVIWAENNDRLLAIFYRRFLTIEQRSEMKHFLFQKLLVLFLKMGLKVGILEEYNLLTPPPQEMSFVGVRAYLYGKVTISYELKPFSETHFNPILDYDLKGYWTSERLLDLGLLQKTQDDGYDFDFSALEPVAAEKGKIENEPNDLADDLKGTAEEIAELLATARRDRLLTNDGLVYLTSCLTVHDCVASIAAEAYIYYQQIDKVLNWTKSALSRNQLTLKFITNLRDYTQNYAWTAVNSGREKYKDYKDKAGHKTVQAITDHFAKQDRFKKRAWEKYWKTEIEEDPNEAPDLHNLNNHFGLLLIELNTLFIYLHQIVFEFAERTGQIARLLDERYGEQRELQKKLTALKAEIKRVQQSSVTADQMAMDFVNATVTQKLEMEEKQLAKELKSTTDNINYWKNFSVENSQRVEEYYHDYRRFAIDEFPLAPEVVNLSCDYLSQIEESLLATELLRTVNKLKAYKHKSNELLKDFSSLVPQWGKINPIVNYNCLLHINTPEENAENRQELAGVVKKVLAQFEQEEFARDDHAARSVVLLRPQKQHSLMGYFIGGKGQFKVDRMTKLASKLLNECSQVAFPFQLLFYPQAERDVSAFYNKHTGYFDEVHENFYSYFLSLESQCLNLHNSLLIFGDEDTYSADHYQRIIRNTLRRRITHKSLRYNNSAGLKNELSQFTLTREPMPKATVIAVITALPKEFAAMRLMLDDIDDNFQKSEDDPNDYCKGTIKSKNGAAVEVLIVLSKGMGNNLSAAAATHVLRSFKEIDDIIMTGIAGGIPDIKKPDNHVRLGDIVVSNESGVLQYDNIKADEAKITIRSTSSKPSARLIGLTRLLEAERFSLKTPWNEYISEKMDSLLQGQRPNSDKDILKIGSTFVEHPNDHERIEGVPKVHFGAIGSANTLLKDERKRDYLRDHYGVKAIEMEASGIADGTWQLSKGYLIVRGIVDYCNDGKNNDWQSYAALCSAAYTKCIIELL